MGKFQCLNFQELISKATVCRGSISVAPFRFSKRTLHAVSRKLGVLYEYHEAEHHSTQDAPHSDLALPGDRPYLLTAATLLGFVWFTEKDVSFGVPERVLINICQGDDP